MAYLQNYKFARQHNIKSQYQCFSKKFQYLHSPTIFYFKFYKNDPLWFDAKRNLVPETAKNLKPLVGSLCL